MKVLITGAFGYLGLALTRWLAVAGHEVCAVGRPPREAAAAGVAAFLAGVKTSQDIGLGANSISTAEAIVHLAGGGAPGGHLSDAAADLHDNVESAVRVAALAPPGARLLLASSIYVYGTGPQPFRESDTLAPDTLYGQLKAVAEAVWHQRGGTALRFAHIYGAGSGVDFGRDGVTERLARAAAKGASFAMHGSGAQQLDLVHVDDACEAVALALRSPGLPPAVNVGRGAPVSLGDLARAFGVCAEASVAAAPPCASRSLDISLAATLGWAPRTTLADGARGLIDMVRGGR